MEFGLSKKQKIVTMVMAFMLLLFLVAGCNSATEETGTDMETNDVDTAGTQNTGSVKTFELTGKNFRFMMNGQENQDIKVRLGDIVRINFASTEGLHDWVVDEFNAATERVMAGNSTSVEFVADKKGTFEYYCSIGSHREQGMKGKLIVE